MEEELSLTGMRQIGKSSYWKMFVQKCKIWDCK